MDWQRGRRAGLLLGIVLASATGGGCSSMSNTEKGVGLGGLLGAGVGTGIGALTHNPKTGAVVGGLAGAGIGGLVGNDMDRKDQHQRDVVQAQANAQALAQVQARRMGITDVVEMVQKGHDEQVIINQIHATGSTFQLSAADLDHLRANNVPSRVIIEMQTYRAPAPTRVIVREPAPATVIYEQPPPPPVYIYRRPPPPPGVYVGGVIYR